MSMKRSVGDQDGLRTSSMYRRGCIIGCVLILCLACGVHARSMKNTSVGKLHYVPGEILVKFKQAVSHEKVNAVHSSFHGRVVQELQRGRVHRVSLPKGMDVLDASKMYTGNPHVEYAEPNYIYHPYGEEPELTWALFFGGVPSAINPQPGDVFALITRKPLGIDDVYEFRAVTTSPRKGDVNHDYTVDLQDVLMAVKAMGYKKKGLLSEAEFRKIVEEVKSKAN